MPGNKLPIPFMVAFLSQRSRGSRRRMLLLTLTMAVVAISIVSMALILSYNTAIDQQRERLREGARHQADLIQSIARFESGYTAAGDTLEVTLSHISEAYSDYGGFGETGTVALARREGSQIVYLLYHENGGDHPSTPISVSSQYAEAMRPRQFSFEVAIDLGNRENQHFHPHIDMPNLTKKISTTSQKRCK